MATALIACGAASAQDWPVRPITMVVPYAAGAPTDVVGCLFAQQMGEILGRQIVVENFPGAGGMTGANRVAQAKPDGYQVLFGGSGNLVYNQALYKKPLFDSLTDFTPIALLTEQSLVLVARRNLHQPVGIRALHENEHWCQLWFGGCRLLDASRLRDVEPGDRSKRHPCPLSRYCGGASRYDRWPHRLHLRFHSNRESSNPGQCGQGHCDLVAFALVDPPEIPTAEEQGIGNIDTANWYGIFLPKGAPSVVVQRLHDTAIAALDAPPVRARLRGLGGEAVAPSRRSPDYLARFLRDDISKWTAPIKASGVTAE